MDYKNLDLFNEFKREIKELLKYEEPEKKEKLEDKLLLSINHILNERIREADDIFIKDIIPYIRHKEYFKELNRLYQEVRLLYNLINISETIKERMNEPRKEIKNIEDDKILFFNPFKQEEKQKRIHLEKYYNNELYYKEKPVRFYVISNEKRIELKDNYKTKLRLIK